MAAPLHKPDGSFAGATAIDVASNRPLNDWHLPEEWETTADTMVLGFSSAGGVG